MEASQELQTLGMAKRSDMAHSELAPSSSYDPDQQNLAWLGKTQVLKVRARINGALCLHVLMSHVEDCHGSELAYCVSEKYNYEAAVSHSHWITLRARFD